MTDTDQERLAKLLGVGWVARLADALEDADKSTADWPGASSAVKLTRQGGKTVDIEGPPRKYRLLLKRS